MRKVYYNWITIVSFIILTVLGLFLLSVYLDPGLTGSRGHYGIPLTYYSAGPPGPFSTDTYSFINLVLNLLIYYVISVLISLSYHKIKNK